MEKNYVQAFKYFQLAANQGDPNGMANLGFMYANGLGIKQNNLTAITLYRKSSEKGNSQGMVNLGYMYLHGYGLSKSISEALKYFKASADQGHPVAQLNLGTLYYSKNINILINKNNYFLVGEGVKQDYSKAITYFSLSAHQGNLIALYNLGQIYQYGLGINPSCSFAVHFYKKVAEQGSWLKNIEEAQSLYQKGHYSQALIKYEKAAHQGYEIAQSNVGWLYDKDFGIIYENVSDQFHFRYKKAFEYFKKSGEQRNSFSLLKIGDYYYYGLGVEINYEKAALFYQLASDQGNAQAMFNLGYMHQVKILFLLLYKFFFKTKSMD